MYQLMYHMGIFNKTLAAFATRSEDPAHFHEAVESVAMHRLENPVNATKAEDILKTGDITHMLTPSMEVAATLTAQFGEAENREPNVACTPFVASAFDNPMLATIRNLYHSIVETGYISPVMLLFSAEHMNRPENNMVAVFGFGHQPDVDFLVMTVDLPQVYKSLNVADSIAAGHDMVIFPLLLSLRDLQVENKITIVSSVNGVNTRLFLLKRDDPSITNLLTQAEQIDM